jgi:hypothetical protein
MVDICSGDAIDQHRIIEIILLDQKVTFDVGYGVNVICPLEAIEPSGIFSFIEASIVSSRPF